MIVIVGAGIAGSALTRVLRDRGADVTLISSGQPHSLAATAVLRRAWHHGPQRELFDESVDAYRRWRIPLAAGAQVTSYRRDGARPDRDWAFVHPAAPLVQPDLAAEVAAIRPGGVTLADGTGIPAGTVVRATGATGPLAIPGLVSWGGTWTAPADAASGIKVHQYAPYKMIATAATGGQWRAGSSSAATPARAGVAADAQLDMAKARGLIPELPGRWRLLTGARVKTPDGQLYGRDQAGWWMGGFHRTGYALAPAVARILADRLC
jgi:glycine/D-amino acid oxidase-like deaminating enzyme